MEKKLFLVVCTLTFMGSILALGDGETDQPSPAPPKTLLVVEKPKEPQPTEKDAASWFLTYLKLSSKIKELSAVVRTFDPSVEIQDDNSAELVATLQRITRDGKNSTLPATDITIITGHFIENADRKLLTVKEGDTPICRFIVDGEEAIIESYNQLGFTQLLFKSKGKLMFKGALPLNYTFDQPQKK